MIDIFVLYLYKSIQTCVCIIYLMNYLCELLFNFHSSLLKMEHCSQALRACVLLLGGPGFESQGRLRWYRFFLGFSHTITSWPMQKTCIISQICRVRFLPPSIPTYSSEEPIPNYTPPSSIPINVVEKARNGSASAEGMKRWSFPPVILYLNVNISK